MIVKAEIRTSISFTFWKGLTLFWKRLGHSCIGRGKITGASNSGFSISGLAVISVPALLYAWLLRNISRVFIQNLNLADDADHRRSLALTYMGLLQDDKRAGDRSRQGNHPKCAVSPYSTPYWRRRSSIRLVGPKEIAIEHSAHFHCPTKH
jgi:hypothetical protein